MRGFNNFILKFLTSTLCTIITLIIISSTFKEVIIDGILSDALKNVFVVNSVNGDSNLLGNNEAMNEILNNEQAQEIFSGFTETMMSEIGSDDQDMSKIDDYDFLGQFKQYMKDNKNDLFDNGEEVTDEMIDQSFSQEGNDSFNKSIKDAINDTKNNMTDEQKSALNSISYFTSDKIHFYITLALVLNILFIVIASWSLYKWLWNIAWGMVVGSAVPIGLGFLIEYIANKSFGFSVDVSPIHNLAFPILVIGFIIGIIYVIIDIVVKKSKKKENGNDVPRIYNTTA